jgi:DnaA family protein
MSAQLALNLRLRDSASLENFLATHNAEAVDCLRRALESAAAGTSTERVIFLAGGSGSGRTHLLQAASRRAGELGLTFAYVPLADAVHLSPALLEDFESTRVVCCDDVDAIAGNRVWQDAMFALAERLRVGNGLLLIAGSAPPASVGLTLPDLVTRLSWGPVFALHSLDDDEKLSALQLRASRMGLELPPDVGRYVIARYPRDMQSLFAWLDRVDRESLAAQRRLTIPFVKGLE